MPGKRARRVWREAARKRPGFIQDEHGTSLGSPPYPAVFSALVTAFGQAWVDFDVYMPDCWATDPQRRAEGRDPGGPGVRHEAGTGDRAAETPDGGRAPRHCGPPPTRCTAAAASSGPRSGRWRWPTSSSSPATTGSPSRKDKVIRADQAVTGAVFERRSCGNGTKGPRYGDWALIATADPREFLLIRRLPGPRQEPVHLLPVLGTGRPARDHDLFHHHRRAQMARGSRPPLLPVKRDLSFTAALLVSCVSPVSAWAGAQRARV